MTLQIRSNLFVYRLFFIALFLLMGILGTGIVVLENYANISIISGSELDRKALSTTFSVIGAIGFSVAFIMILLMQERREPDFDRRQLTETLSFVDRRSSIDRRAV